jgi:hypothetical protein
LGVGFFQGLREKLDLKSSWKLKLHSVSLDNFF